MRRAMAFALLVLAGCGGTAPAVAPPPGLGMVPVCPAAAPPPGYDGPLSPFAAPCPGGPVAAPRPGETWDYSQGMPPRAVRGR